MACVSRCSARLTNKVIAQVATVAKLCPRRDGEDRGLIKYLAAEEPVAVYQVKESDGQRRARVPQPHTPHAAPSFAFSGGRDLIKHRITTTDLRTDLAVMTIAIGVVAVRSVITFMFIR